MLHASVGSLEALVLLEPNTASRVGVERTKAQLALWLVVDLPWRGRSVCAANASPKELLADFRQQGRVGDQISDPVCFALVEFVVFQPGFHRR